MPHVSWRPVDRLLMLFAPSSDFAASFILQRAPLLVFLLQIRSSLASPTTTSTAFVFHRVASIVSSVSLAAGVACSPPPQMARRCGTASTHKCCFWLYHILPIRRCRPPERFKFRKSKRRVRRCRYRGGRIAKLWKVFPRRPPWSCFRTLVAPTFLIATHTTAGGVNQGQGSSRSDCGHLLSIAWSPVGSVVHLLDCFQR